MVNGQIVIAVKELMIVRFQRINEKLFDGIQILFIYRNFRLQHNLNENILN